LHACRAAVRIQSQVRVGIIALCYHSQLIKSDSTMTIRHVGW
jgi:hypothetical protein